MKQLVSVSDVRLVSVEVMPSVHATVQAQFLGSVSRAVWLNVGCRVWNQVFGKDSHFPPSTTTHHQITLIKTLKRGLNAAQCDHIISITS